MFSASQFGVACLSFLTGALFHGLVQRFLSRHQGQAASPTSKDASQAAAVKQPAPAQPSFCLDELVGKSVAENYSCEAKMIVVRGLTVASWAYTAKSLSGLPLPTVVAVHGGPAFTHCYLLPLIRLCDAGYRVIFYDQAGCGESSPGVDLASSPWLLTISYYALEELPAVLHAWSLIDYFLYGNSWGTCVVQEYAVTQPKGLLAIVLDGALCDSELYISSQWRDNLSTLPLLTQERMRLIEERGEFDSAEYKAINDALTSQFTSRLLPPAQCFLDSLAKANQEIYVKMQGPSEFAIGGVLKGWSITDRLKNVTVPALVLRGAFDSMTEACSQAVVDAIPLAQPLVTLPRAAHVKTCDEPAAVAEATAAFLVSIR
jgi:proline-specific peptidase